MNYSIMFTSQTGNTEILANTVLHSLPLAKCTYFGGFNSEQAENSDLIFVGFWNDKGDCPNEVKDFLKGLKNKRIALFGTSGFAEYKEYLKGVVEKVKENISPENEVVGDFMCKGRINQKVKEEFEKNAKNEKDIELMLKSYDSSFSHPNIRDLVNIRDFARDMYYFI